jgi:hypothetical protein
MTAVGWGMRWQRPWSLQERIIGLSVDHKAVYDSPLAAVPEGIMERNRHFLPRGSIQITVASAFGEWLARSRRRVFLIANDKAGAKWKLFFQFVIGEKFFEFGLGIASG